MFVRYVEGLVIPINSCFVKGVMLLTIAIVNNLHTRMLVMVPTCVQNTPDAIVVGPRSMVVDIAQDGF